MRHKCDTTYNVKNPQRSAHLRKRLFRSPKRISITIPYGTYQTLLERSENEGRSLSNLAAYLLESASSNKDQKTTPYS